MRLSSMLPEHLVFATALLSFPMVFLWMGVHAYGLFKLGGRLNQISRGSAIAWIISGTGGMLGPLVVLTSLVSVVLALRERSRGDASPETALALRTVLLTGAIMVAMFLMLLVPGLLMMATA